MNNQPFGEPGMNIPPLQNLPQAVSPKTPSPHGSHGLLIAIISVGIVVILGGGYFAYARGYISLPFLPAVKDTNVGTTNTTSHQNQNTQAVTNTVANTSTLVSAKLGAMPAPLSAWNSQPFGGTTGGTNASTGGYVLHPALSSAPQTLAAGIAACDAVAPKTALELGKNYCYMDVAAGFRAASVCEKTSSAAGDLSQSTFSEDVTQCYTFFAKIYAPFDCSSVATQPYRDYCYAAYAAGEKQATLDCSPIQDATIKAQCTQDVQDLRDSSAGADTLASYQLAICYINKHPDILNSMPKNAVTDSYKDYTNSSSTQKDCAALDQAKIEAAKSTVITDADHDGLTLMTEDLFGTSDTKADTDGNGINDYQQFAGNTNTNVSSPSSSTVDSDGDNLPDNLETTQYHTDPKKADTDGDGLSDYEEVSGYLTNPLKADTDGDGHNDGTEVCHSYNPLGAGGYNSPLPYPPASCPPNLTPTGTTRPAAQNKTTMTIDGLAATAANGMATVTWTTKEGAYAAVYFGTTAKYDEGRYPDSLAYLTNHSASFPVTAGTTYHYAVLSCPKSIFYLSECALSSDQTVVGK